MPKFTVVRAQRISAWHIERTNVTAPSLKAAILKAEDSDNWRPVKNHGKESTFHEPGTAAAETGLPDLDDLIDTACENAE